MGIIVADSDSVKYAKISPDTDLSDLHPLLERINCLDVFSLPFCSDKILRS